MKIFGSRTWAEI